jgi:DNA-binding GntR family transcriptional regulator
MPKRYGVKEKDQVVAHVINLVMTGKLRSGDRIDRNEIAKDLGLSRVPIQEAMVQLEHDGIVSTRYHRGAFVERFDEATLREHHELYGLLNGLVSARAATNPTPRVLAELDSAMRLLRSAKDGKSFQEACWIYRDTINDEYAGPRLHAAILASQNFAPSDFWATYPRFKSEFLPTYEDETQAIRGGDPAAARAVWDRRAELMARIMVAELTRRGVLGELRSH